MPLYEYRCLSCGHTFDAIQKFSDPPLKTCPECGKKVEKCVSSPAIQFKGSGFYITDYARKDSSSASSASSSPVSTDTKSNGTTEKKTDAGSASPSTSKSDSKDDSSD